MFWVFFFFVWRICLVYDMVIASSPLALSGAPMISFPAAKKSLLPLVCNSAPFFSPNDTLFVIIHHVPNDRSPSTPRWFHSPLVAVSFSTWDTVWNYCRFDVQPSRSFTASQGNCKRSRRFTTNSPPGPTTFALWVLILHTEWAVDRFSKPDYWSVARSCFFVSLSFYFLLHQMTPPT